MFDYIKSLQYRNAKFLEIWNNGEQVCAISCHCHNSRNILRADCHPFTPGSVFIVDESKILLCPSYSALDSHPNRPDHRSLNLDIGKEYCEKPFAQLSGEIVSCGRITAASPQSHVATEYGIPESHCLTAESLLDEIAEAYSRLGDLICLQQQSQFMTSPSALPPPMPLSSMYVQTEILGGELEGMGNRLLLYRNRIKTLEERLELENQRRSLAESELEKLRDGSREEEIRERVQTEIHALKEINQLQEVKLKDMERLINYYIEEVKSLEEKGKR